MHEGHRERLYRRYLSDEEVLSDVELVELLLCYCITRKDVKPIAKRLIDKFGSPKGVISAPPDALALIEGVGDKTVAFLGLINKISGDGACGGRGILSSVANTVEYFREFFKDFKTEHLVISLLTKDGKIAKNFVATSLMRSEISTSLTDLSAEIAQVHPHSAIIAHNHFSGNVEPSEADDIATRRIAVMLGVQGITLYDHIILCDDKYFSYHGSGRLADIKDEIYRVVK